MNQFRDAPRKVEIDKLIDGSPVEYSYQFKTNEELLSAVKGYPQNMKQYGTSSLWDVSNVNSQFAGGRWNLNYL
jgi:hypothetical protein